MPKDKQPREEQEQPPEENSADSQRLQDTHDTEAADAMTGDSGPSSEDGDPADLIEQFRNENVELKDQFLRKSADFDNFRKRMIREKEEFAAYANRELLLDIVGIVDDFERAIKSADESQDFTAFHDGIGLIEKQFTTMLERKWKLKRFDSAGEVFDPQKHEAMLTEERSEHDESVVLEDFQKGYMLHDRVLRPAKVKVSIPAAGETDSDGATIPDAGDDGDR